MDAAAFRAQFPVLRRIAYLNSGTAGPLPERSVAAATRELEHEAQLGRSGLEHYAQIGSAAEELRSELAALLGADQEEIALTRSTTDGVNAILGGLALGPGDEVLTSDEEHPGLHAPLGALRRAGIEVRVAPFADVPDAAGPKTRLVAVSHVSWLTGRVAPVAELASLDAPLLLDGAQALGAIPVDVRSLGCDFYAASGQKWLCGPDGSGALYVRSERLDDIAVTRPAFVNLGDVVHPLDLVPAHGARRFDRGEAAGPLIAASLESLRVLEEAGWSWVFDRACSQAAELRSQLSERTEVIPGGDTTLVTWRPPGVEDGEGALMEASRLAREGVVVRALPERPWLRASVGAWSSEDDLGRLLAC